MYVPPGVRGGVVFGSRPSNARCEGVKGISENSSFRRNRGYRAVKMLKKQASRTRSRGYSPCSAIGFITL